MNAISIGDALGEGFALIRRHPLLVLVWGGLLTIRSIILTVMMSPTYAGMAQYMAAFQKTVKAKPTSALANFWPLLSFEGQLMLIGMISTLIGLIFTCAVFRAIVHPERGRFAYLRLGRAELFLCLYAVGALIVLLVAAVAAFVPAGIAAALSGVANAPAIGVLAAVLALIAVLAAAVWIGVRLSLLGPMIVESGTLRLAEAWRLSKGRAGALFAIGLCLLVIYIIVAVISVVLSVVTGAVPMQTFTHMGQPGKMPTHLLPPLSPGLVVRYLIAVPISGCTLAIAAAPWARAYRDLVQPDVAATFA